MGFRSTRAVVSHTMRISNSSKIVSLVTEDWGLLKVMAKGARRPSSQYGAALEPVTMVDCVFSHKEGREIQTLIEADIIESWSALKTNLKKFSAASCMTEIAETCTPPDDPSAGTFGLLVDSLCEIDQADVEDTDKHLWRCMLRFLEASGYNPDLTRCRKCNRKPSGKTVFVSYPDGCIICACTNTEGRYGSYVSPGALMVMNELATSSPGDIPRIRMTSVQRAEVEKTILQLLAYHSGSSRTPKALAFIRRMEADKKVIRK